MSRALIAALALSLAGCGGPLLLREPAPIVESQPLIETSDSGIAIAVDAVVVRNGVGSWTRNAGWDEYRFRIRSLSGGELRLLKITLRDALGQPVESVGERATLLEGTQEVAKRYAAAGLPEPSTQRERGWFPGGYGYVGVGVFVVAAIAQVINDAQVNSRLKELHTPLPAAIGSKDSTVVAFFPIVLRPAAIEVSYVDDGFERLVSLAPRDALRRVRESRVAQALHRPEPRFTADMARRLADGRVKAQLLVDASGSVSQVDILESSNAALVYEAKRTFAQYKFTEGATGRSVEEVMLFKRGAGAP